MQRPTHYGRLGDCAARELAFARFATEVRAARPPADIRLVRPLSLHPDESLDERGGREPLPLQQELAGERRAVQFAQGQDADGGSFAAGFCLRVRSSRPISKFETDTNNSPMSAALAATLAVKKGSYATGVMTRASLNKRRRPVAPRQGHQKSCLR